MDRIDASDRRNGDLRSGVPGSRLARERYGSAKLLEYPPVFLRVAFERKVLTGPAARSSRSSAFHFAPVSRPQQYGGPFPLGRGRAQTHRARRVGGPTKCQRPTGIILPTWAKIALCALPCRSLDNIEE